MNQRPIDFKTIFSLNTDFVIEQLQEKHLDEAIQVMIESFCDYEPMTQYVDMQYEEFRPFAEQVLKKAVRDGISAVALKNGHVVACTAVEDITQPIEFTIELTPKFKPIFTLLEEITIPYLHGKQFPPGYLAHLFITAVSPNYHHQGLSRQINFKSMQLAIDKGFQLMCSEMTNFINEKGTMAWITTPTHRMGSCQYNQFVMDNTKPFQTLSGGANALIWALKPGIPLEPPTIQQNLARLAR